MGNQGFKVGIIGFGFIGQAHAMGYWSIPYLYNHPAVTAQVAALLRTSTGRDEQLIERLGSPFVTDSIEAFKAQNLDLVDVCTPNALHREEIRAVSEMRVPIYCEKPLGLNLNDAREIQRLAKDAGVLTHTAFMMRYYPAVRQAKAILEKGGLGEIYHFRAQYFHSSYMDPQRPTSWRLQKEMSGGGAMTDLGIHIMDMIQYLLGDVAWVQARAQTLIKQRPSSKGSSRKVAVDVDDWGICLLGMKNGGYGSLESSRMGSGASEEAKVEIFGSQGSITIDLRNPLQAQYYDAQKNQMTFGKLNFSTPEGERPTGDLWPSAKSSLGYFKDAHTASIYDFLLNIHENKESPINFKIAVQAQEILEAFYLSSTQDGQIIHLPIA